MHSLDFHAKYFGVQMKCHILVSKNDAKIEHHFLIGRWTSRKFSVIFILWHPDPALKWVLKWYFLIRKDSSMVLQHLQFSKRKMIAFANQVTPFVQSVHQRYVASCRANIRHLSSHGKPVTAAQIQILEQNGNHGTTKRHLHIFTFL